MAYGAIPGDGATSSFDGSLSPRQDNKLAIAKRTGGLTIANLDEAVKRAKAYVAAEAGAIGTPILVIPSGSLAE